MAILVTFVRLTLMIVPVTHVVMEQHVQMKSMASLACVLMDLEVPCVMLILMNVYLILVLMGVPVQMKLVVLHVRVLPV